MTRSNLHITLTGGKQIICVADSSSAPEQGYIVEQVLIPLLNFDDRDQELELLKNHCTMDDRRTNATYRYEINLMTKKVSMYEENYNFRAERFYKGKDLTERYSSYVENLKNQEHEKGT